MKAILIAIVIIFLSDTVKAQSQDTTIYKYYRLKTDTTTYIATYPSLGFDALPQFPGGEKKLNNFFRETIHYPQSAKEKRLEGKVFITFIIEKDGHVSHAEIIRGISTDLDNEAIRVIMALPKWEPAIYENKPVRVQYMLPVRFELPQ